MSRSKWAAIKPGDSALMRILDALTRAIQPMFDALNVVLHLKKTAYELVKTFTTDLLNVQTTLILESLDLVRSALEDLTGEGGAGVYFIPIPVIPVDRDLSNDILYSTADAGGGGNEEGESAAQAALRAVLENRLGSGGNAGFMDTLQKSMSDQFDPMRPQFDPDAHVAGVLVYAGADVYTKLLAVLTRMATVFGEDGPTFGVGSILSSTTDMPKPKNLVAEVVPSNETAAWRPIAQNYLTGENSDTPMAIRLSWDLEDRTHVLPYPANADEPERGNMTLQITEVYVYRSETKITPSMIGTEELAKKLIKSYEFNGWQAEFYDNSVEAGKNYYYAVGYKTELQNTDDPDTTVPTEELAVPLALSYVQGWMPPSGSPRMTRQGVPPDWFVVPSPLSLIPTVTNTVRQIEKILDTVEDTVRSTAETISDYINEIDKQIDFRAGQVTRTVENVQKLIEALKWDGVFVGAVGFAGKGGNPLIIDEIRGALFDPSDDERPEFDTGYEPVAGFVIVAGSETAGKLQAFIAAVEMLFGIVIQGAESTSTALKDTWEAAIESIDAAAAQTRDNICLEDDLQTLAGCEEKIAVKTFSDDMQPDSDGDTSCTGN